MWIEFGTINYKLIIPFIYPFLFQIRRLIHKEKEKPFYLTFTNYLGYLFAGLIYLIIVYRTKKKKQKNALTNPNNKKIQTMIELDNISADGNSSQSSVGIQKTIRIRKNSNSSIENQINVEKNKINKRMMKKKYLFILGLSLIYLIPMFLDSYCSSSEKMNFKTSSSISLFFSIISYILLSRFILGHKIHRHQILSVCIIITCNIISISLIITGENKNYTNIAINIGVMAAIVSLYALYNVLEKIFFNAYMTSPYYLMFAIGAISLSLIIIYEIITCLAFSIDEVFNGVFFQIKKNFQEIKLYPLIFIADIISAFLWLAGIHLTIYFFTPCHFITSESISQILSTIINNTLEAYSVSIRVIIYILFVIIILASFIYNEIIILNFCRLNVNTKKKIEVRSNSEVELMFEDNKNKDLIDIDTEESIN